jgi:TonB family protein
MIEEAKQWQGQLLGGKFLLDRFLGGSEGSAVFLVEASGRGESPTVIRLADANAPGADEQLEQWKAAARLNHPNLIRTFEAGRCQIAGRDLLYVVAECAEENLAQILPERALTAEEAQKVLEAVLAALAYIHSEGFVHRGLKPSNIFAVGDTVKVANDTIHAAGSSLPRRSVNPHYDAPEVLSGRVGPPADVWSLGVMLTEVLTQQAPQFDSHLRMHPAFLLGIPEPFQEIIENCLQSDPGRRWSLAQIGAHLRGGRAQVAFPAAGRPVRQKERSASSAETGGSASAKWPYALVLVAVVVVALVLFGRLKTPASQTTEAPASNAASVASSPAPVNLPGEVVDRVMPRVSPGALHTIQGRIRVQVEVNVDEKGEVADARLKLSGPSHYFASRSLDAGKEWKFKPPVEKGQPVASRWVVHFIFRPQGVESSAEQTKPQPSGLSRIH